MALISHKEVKETPHQEPANPRLWNLTVLQAKQRFSKYPSPAAAHWVHSHYAQMGGKFVSSKREVDPRLRDYVHEAQEKREEAVKKKVTKRVGTNIIKGESFKY